MKANEQLQLDKVSLKSSRALNKCLELRASIQMQIQCNILNHPHLDDV